ncbi:GntR family transcriptional regulator [Paenibacillus sp. J5C_2022]|uniref:GntR family transcriptional regulator n=1 Tax=Paenibacillus sp. J5C2022 TaxID=2977129 RepID=UPI0021CEDF48|nr:GntR family transcriptional regulator [Paenibacillus sp. J5C2022]MCU6712554.1 GntR family transcriptional regulator [Paenibacillus sp. J5C2022]
MRLPIVINEHSAEPLYHQIEVQLRALIVSGQLEEGTMLPSIRELAGMMKCSVITVKRVYRDLEAEGLLRTRQGTGTFVTHAGEGDRDRQRLSSVVEALELALQAAIRVQCTREELEELFRAAMRQHYDKGGEST